jgi:phosphate-selective porin
MKSTWVCIALLPCSAPTLAAETPRLFGVPTEYESPSGFEFDAGGVYQYDFNDFSNRPVDPVTGAPPFGDAHTWNRRKLDLYAKWSNGFEIDAGYDWDRSWTDNYIKYSSKTFGDFRVGQVRTQVGWEPMEGAQFWTFLTPGLPGHAIFEDRRIGADWGGQATPMTYLADGKQYTAIAAGGHGGLDTKRGDDLMVYSLPKNAAAGSH